MQCTACGGQLEYAGGGQYARCMRCLALFQVAGGGLTPIVVQAPGGGNNPEFNAMFAKNLGFGPPPAGGGGGGGGGGYQHGPSFQMGDVEVRVDTRGLERRAMNEVSSMIWGWIIGGVILVMLVIGGIVLGVYIYLQAKSSTVADGSGATGKKTEQTWDGKSTLECSGIDKMKITGTTASLTTTAIKASGNCQLELVNVNITAPVGIEATASAKVTMTGGSIKAKDNSVVASNASSVTFVGTSVTGVVKKQHAAKVNGAN